jgi:FkbM family methyltransferase
LFLWSLKLDLLFLSEIKDIPFLSKIQFILLKYIAYAKHILFESRRKILSVNILQRKFYFHDALGVASLQRVFCESYKLKDFVSEDSIVIDVGANVGQFNFFCQQYLRAKRVISIEPLEDCFHLLKLNAKDPQDCMNGAISNEGDRLTIYVPKSSPQHSSSIRSDGEECERSVIVRAMKLDDIKDEYNIVSCDVLKIDTEGSEYDVLLSGEGLLSESNCVLVELSVYRPSTGNLFTVGEFLQQRGFRLMHLHSYSSDLSSVEGIFQRV